MKIKIELDDGYEQVFEVDEENDEIEDLGTTKEMMQARIEELEELNRDKSGDVAFYHEANMACMREINALRDKATGWEKRCEELEQELRDAQDRIHEMDWTIAQYDDENRELKDAMDSTDTEISMFRGELAKAEAELDECRKDKNRLMEECTELGKRLLARPLTNGINGWARAIHDNAVAHGWWTGGVLDGERCGIFEDVDRPLPEILMLCVCELAESMEEYRDGKPLIYEGENGKPEGIAVEMGDCIIRILDWMGHNGVDVDEMIRKKHEYNKTRPYRHGGKLA